MDKLPKTVLHSQNGLYLASVLRLRPLCPGGKSGPGSSVLRMKGLVQLLMDTQQEIGVLL